MTESPELQTPASGVSNEELVLRRATPADTEALVDFNSRVHSDFGWEQPFEPVGAWVRDLMTKDHPTFNPADFTIVEDRDTGQVISSLNLISQTWTYGGIPFKVGRPELVGTHPDYRNRGLVRAQFKEIHRWSAERGELAQMITGIPFYYRLFGYEMAINLGGGRTGYTPHIPGLDEGQNEPYPIRPAGESDLPFISALYDLGIKRSLLACQRDEAAWRYELNGHSPTSINGRALAIIENEAGEAVGFIAHPRTLWDVVMPVTWYEIKPGVSWLDATTSLVRYLARTGEAYAVKEGKTCQAFTLSFGADHPAYEAFKDRMPRVYPPYAYYVRVPDLPAFLNHVRPVLEERLANSIAVGYSGELKLSFYRSGLRLEFKNGRIQTIEAWQPAPLGQSGNAIFPGLTFLQLVFGYRSLEELRYAFPDCIYRGDTTRVLLNTLFPKQASDVWPLN